MDELTATPNRRNSLNQQQSDMEERLKLHEQQMREMVFDLMQTKASNQMSAYFIDLFCVAPAF